MNFLTADLIDAHGEDLESCATQFRQFGQRHTFHGTIRTLATLEDNALVRQLLETPGHGSVLVIDGRGSLRTALIGDEMAALALASGWAGIVINGAVRDSAALGAIAVGIKAVGTNPRRSSKLGTGSIDVPVTFGGATFRPGSWLYSDDDGVVVSARRLH